MICVIRIQMIVVTSGTELIDPRRRSYARGGVRRSKSVRRNNYIKNDCDPCRQYGD